MKKLFKSSAILLIVAVFFSSCATIFNGSASVCQKTKPAAGQPARDVRVLPLILDCFCLPFLAVDFATGAIYEPCELNKPIK